MADGSPHDTDLAAEARMRSLLITFRQVGLPLLQALSETPDTTADEAHGVDGAKFSKLVESTVSLSRELATALGAQEEDCDAWIRWALAGSASQVVAANFQATGQAMSADDAKTLAQVVADLQTRFKTQIPSGSETIPNTVATFRAKMMEAMVPVIGAVARYSFGRAEHTLLAEVAEKLVRTADQITRALAPAGSSAEEWRLLCWSVLRASGQIYADSHYAEADRLLYMSPEERTAYYAQNSNTPPMTQVWQAFNQRMAMLATLATYLEVPPSAQRDTESLQ